MLPFLVDAVGRRPRGGGLLFGMGGARLWVVLVIVVALVVLAVWNNRRR